MIHATYYDILGFVPYLLRYKLTLYHFNIEQ